MEEVKVILIKQKEEFGLIQKFKNKNGHKKYFKIR